MGQHTKLSPYDELMNPINRNLLFEQFLFKKLFLFKQKGIRINKKTLHMI